MSICPKPEVESPQAGPLVFIKKSRLDFNNDDIRPSTRSDSSSQNSAVHAATEHAYNLAYLSAILQTVGKKSFTTVIQRAADKSFSSHCFTLTIASS